MNKNAVLGEIDFGNEAGDDASTEELKGYFVEQNAFREFVSTKKRILMATAKKGVGKSALIKWIEQSVAGNETDTLIITCKGRDLVRANFPINAALETPNDYINDWMSRICCIIARQLGKELNIALQDDAITLVEISELAGIKSRNIVSAVFDRMKKLIPSVERIRLESANYEELVKRVLNKQVWFLVDDLDATYQRTNQENLSLGTFFSACRYLIKSLTGIYFRVTMRTDVWPMIRRYDESLDKVDQYVRDITWSQDDFRKLLARRIASQVDDVDTKKPVHQSYTTDEEKDEYYINMVFAKRMEWGEFDKRTYKIIYTLSYQRPRWAIQLCKAAQQIALANKSEVIDREHLTEVWAWYGRKRIADLVAEHKHQCKEVEELVSAFRGAERRMNRGILIEWVKNKITNHMTPVIDGAFCKRPLEVAHFLYRIGFIVARIDGGNNEFEHYHFSEMPDFLSSRTNEDFGAIWEIHPCYREALDIVKLNKYQKKQRT